MEETDAFHVRTPGGSTPPPPKKVAQGSPTFSNTIYSLQFQLVLFSVSGISVKHLSSPSPLPLGFFLFNIPEIMEPQHEAEKHFQSGNEESACLQLPRNSRAAGLTKAIINGQLGSTEPAQHSPLWPCDLSCSTRNSAIRHSIRTSKGKGGIIDAELKITIPAVSTNTSCCRGN